MQILFLTNLYPPYDLGGMEQLCEGAVEGLRDGGHAGHVLASGYDVREQPPAEEGVIRILHLQANVNYYRPLDSFLRRPWQEGGNQRAMRCALDELQLEVIFVWELWNLSPRVAYRAEQRIPD